jgi:flagellar biosynthetic protein FliO
MKPMILIAVLVLGSAGSGWAQTAAAPAPAAVAPLPDEKTLTITDTTGSPANPAPAPSADVGFWDFVKMFVVLALVIGMIVGFLWFMRKLSGQGPGADSPVKVLHTHSLGGSRALQVVDVAGQILLIGSGDGSPRLIKDLTGTEAADAIHLAASQGNLGGKAGFGELLGNLMGVKPKIRPDVTAPVENSSDFLKKQRERLKNMENSGRT